MLVRQTTPNSIMQTKAYRVRQSFHSFHTVVLSHTCGFMVSWWRLPRDNLYIRSCRSDLVLQSEDCQFPRYGSSASCFGVVENDHSDSITVVARSGAKEGESLSGLPVAPPQSEPLVCVVRRHLVHARAVDTTLCKVCVLKPCVVLSPLLSGCCGLPGPLSTLAIAPSPSATGPSPSSTPGQQRLLSWNHALKPKACLCIRTGCPDSAVPLTTTPPL
eukprot:6491936-Amphidinium_carterae.3